MRAISGEEMKNITTRILYITFGERFRPRRFSDATFYLRGVSSYFVLRFCAIVLQSFTQYRGRFFFFMYYYRNSVMVYPIRNIPTALENWEFCETTCQNKRTHGTKGSPRDNIRCTRGGIYGTLCTSSGSTSARSPVALHVIPRSILPFTSFSVVVPSCSTVRQHIIILPSYY